MSVVINPYLIGATDNITGRIVAGTNLALSGSGSAGDPYKLDFLDNIHYFSIVQDADNTTALNALMATLSAANGGIIKLSEGNMNNSRTVPKSDIFLIGSGRRTTFKTTINRVAVFQNTVAEDLNHFGIFNCRFIGGVTEIPTQPQHSRANTGTGITTAFEIHGSLEPDSAFSGAGGSKDSIYFCQNWVEGCSSLPILIGGASNVYILDNNFYNNKDVGVRFCTNVMVRGNRVSLSADNGISLSRGNDGVTASHNIINLCAFDGIWFGGVGTDNGCKNFSCVNNEIQDVGYNGINMKLASKNGVVTGNFVRQGYWRGPVDAISNINSGTGITVGGIPDHSSSTTAFADNILVANNVLMECSRAGLFSTGGTSNCSYMWNKILNVGNQYAADGSTAILSTDITTNCGIIFENTAANFNNRVIGNQVDDTRGTTYMNYPMVPTVLNTTFSDVRFNTGNGSWRQTAQWWCTGFKQGFASGTVYNLTATNTRVAFGTTQADLTMAEQGQFLIVANINLRYNAATFAGSRTVTLILKKSTDGGSTFAALTNSTRTLSTDIITAKTYTMADVTFECAVASLNVGDIIALFADVSVVPTAGNLEINQLSLRATKF